MQNCDDNGEIFIHPCAARNNLEIKFQNMDIHRGQLCRKLYRLYVFKKQKKDMICLLA